MASRRLSSRFLSPQEPARSPGPAAFGDHYPEGRWSSIRVVLESQGWSASQIERLHDLLRQGWSLPMAKHHLSSAAGRCPLLSRRDG
jgi:hypothetical protein